MLQGRLTQGARRFSRLGQARDREGLLAVQEGHLKPVTASHKDVLLKKIILERSGVGKADRLCSRVLQKQDSAGDALRECDSQGPSDTLGPAGKTLYECKACGKVFNKNCLLVLQQWIHTGVETYACQECGKAFREKVDFVQHRRIFTLGRSPISVQSVGRPSTVGHISCTTRGFTLARSPMSAGNVERPLPTTLLLSGIIRATLEKKTCECR